MTTRYPHLAEHIKELEDIFEGDILVVTQSEVAGELSYQSKSADKEPGYSDKVKHIKSLSATLSSIQDEIYAYENKVEELKKRTFGTKTILKIAIARGSTDKDAMEDLERQIKKAEKDEADIKDNIKNLTEKLSSTSNELAVMYGSLGLHDKKKAVPVEKQKMSVADIIDRLYGDNSPEYLDLDLNEADMLSLEDMELLDIDVSSNEPSKATKIIHRIELQYHDNKMYVDYESGETNDIKLDHDILQSKKIKEFISTNMETSNIILYGIDVSGIQHIVAVSNDKFTELTSKGSLPNNKDVISKIASAVAHMLKIGGINIKHIAMMQPYILSALENSSGYDTRSTFDNMANTIKNNAEHILSVIKDDEEYSALTSIVENALTTIKIINGDIILQKNNTVENKSRYQSSLHNVGKHYLIDGDSMALPKNQVIALKSEEGYNSTYHNAYIRTTIDNFIHYMLYNNLLVDKLRTADKSGEESIRDVKASLSENPPDYRSAMFIVNSIANTNEALMAEAFSILVNAIISSSTYSTAVKWAINENGEAATKMAESNAISKIYNILIREDFVNHMQKERMDNSRILKTIAGDIKNGAVRAHRNHEGGSRKVDGMTGGTVNANDIAAKRYSLEKDGLTRFQTSIIMAIDKELANISGRRKLDGKPDVTISDKRFVLGCILNDVYSYMHSNEFDDDASIYKNYINVQRDMDEHDIIRRVMAYYGVEKLFNVLDNDNLERFSDVSMTKNINKVITIKTPYALPKLIKSIIAVDRVDAVAGTKSLDVVYDDEDGGESRMQVADKSLMDKMLERKIAASYDTLVKSYNTYTKILYIRAKASGAFTDKDANKIAYIKSDDVSSARFGTVINDGILRAVIASVKREDRTGSAIVDDISSSTELDKKAIKKDIQRLFDNIYSSYEMLSKYKKADDKNRNTADALVSLIIGINHTKDLTALSSESNLSEAYKKLHESLRACGIDRNEISFESSQINTTVGGTMKNTILEHGGFVYEQVGAVGSPQAMQAVQSQVAADTAAINEIDKKIAAINASANTLTQQRAGLVARVSKLQAPGQGQPVVASQVAPLGNAQALPSAQAADAAANSRDMTLGVLHECESPLIKVKGNVFKVSKKSRK